MNRIPYTKKWNETKKLMLGLKTSGNFITGRCDAKLIARTVNSHVDKKCLKKIT